MSLPFSEESEKALLCSMLIDKEVAEKAARKVKEEVFYMPCHGLIFKAIREAVLAERPSDFPSLISAIGERGMAEIGGKEYLSSLYTFIPTGVAWEHYYGVLSDKLDRRNAIIASERISLLAADDASLFTEIEQIASGIVGSRVNQDGIVGAASLASELSQCFDAIGDDDNRGVSMTLSGVKDLVKRIRPGELCLIGGASGDGKTSLANSILVKSCIPNKQPALYFSLEMSTREQGMRLVSIAGRIPLEKLLDRIPLDKLENQRFAKALTDLHTSKIAIMDQVVGIQEAFAIAKDYKEINGLDLVVIDYAHLMLGLNGHHGEVRHELEHIGKTCKWMAKKMNCAVILLTQIHDGDYMPAECKGLMRHPDIYMVVSADQETLQVLKQRNAPKGTCKVQFYGPSCEFY